MDNFESKKSVLLAAISDLSGNLKLIDTKVSIIIASSGIFFGGLINCRSNILKAYRSFESFPLCKYFFFGVALIYIISILALLFFGIRTIIPRIGKSKRFSIWFFNTDDVSEDEYKTKIQKYSDENLIDTLESEVYKLNKINRTKIHQSQKAVISFVFSFGSFLTVMMMVGLYYLGAL